MTKQYTQKLVSYLSVASAVALTVALQAPQAKAASITFTGAGTNTYSGSNNPLGASVTFDDAVNAGKLTIKLENKGPGALAPSDVLTTVFWDYDGSPISFNLDSAVGNIINNGSVTNNFNLLSPSPAQWKLPNVTLPSGGVTQKYGLSSTGLGLFNSAGGTGSPAYGIISGYGSGANNAITTNPYVKDFATFVLSGLPSNFDVTKISNIRFQYGTNLTEPSFGGTNGGGGGTKVPEPATMFGLGLVASGMAMARRRRNFANN
ncbi:PEP-CTERM sorting domain-containing protein [Anabaena azotica]|uniref:PEP-CTERM sorting domain-containing protein n=1 Tax=Anabaena azotica TaxID=197653 RepID=UPI0039A40E6C